MEALNSAGDHLMHPTFNPRRFTDIADRPESRALWEALNTDVAKTKMRTASDLGRPALEGVAEDLLVQFERQFADDNPFRERFKQMAGAMARQVMEGEGYVWVRDNVPMSGVPFSRASKYRHRDADDLHVWRLSTNPRFIGVTLVKDNSQLPAQVEGSWVYYKLVDGKLQHRRSRLYFGAGIRDIVKAQAELESSSFYIEQTERITRAA
jgi:hypothetical protein